MSNFSFVIDSSFDPMSFKDRLAPFLIAKPEYDKLEQDYIDRQDKIDAYSFLNDYADSSPAKQLYQGYVNEYSKSFDDYKHHGLTPANKRSWLDVRSRYQKNIGRLEKADADLQEELKRRRTLDAADPTRIYSKDTVSLNIDDYLDRKRPDEYSVSGDALYKRGAEIGASTSSRIYSDPTIKKMTDAFVNFTQTQGITQDTLDAFRANLSSQPAFQKAIIDELKAQGVTDHLKGAALQRAIQSTVNGFINGAIYKRTDNPQANPDHITAYQQRALSLQEQQLAEQKREFNETNNTKLTIAALKANGKNGKNGKNVAYKYRTLVNNPSGGYTTYTPSDENYREAMKDARPVDVEKDYKYVGGKPIPVYFITGKSGFRYASVAPDSTGRYVVKMGLGSKYKDYFKKDFGSYSDADNHNLLGIGNAVIDILSRDDDYLRYNFALAPDGNGYFIDPLSMEDSTGSNSGLDLDDDTDTWGNAGSSSNPSLDYDK